MAEPALPAARTAGRARLQVARRSAAGLVAVGAALATLATYVIPGWEVCHARLTTDGRAVQLCGPISADDSILIGLVLFLVLLLLIPDVSEFGIAGLVTLKRRVESVERRQHDIEFRLSLSHVQSQQMTVNLAGELVAVLRRAPIENVAAPSYETADFTVTPSYLAPAEALARGIEQSPPVSPEQLAERIITAVLSAGGLERGRAAQVGGAITITMTHPLTEGTSIRIGIDTPGVRFDVLPVLSSNIASGSNPSVRLESGQALVVDLAGPTALPPRVMLSNISFAVEPDAPLGAVRMSVSVGGAPTPAIVSIATIRA